MTKKGVCEKCGYGIYFCDCIDNAANQSPRNNNKYKIIKKKKSLKSLFLENMIEVFKLIELQCQGIIFAIQLHRDGIEAKDEVIVRIKNTMDTWNKIFNNKGKRKK